MEKSRLHWRIVNKLADTLSKVHQDTVNMDDITRFVSKCPSLITDNNTESTSNIFTQKQKDSFKLGRMTRRQQEALGAFIKYAMTVSSRCQEHILPKLLNYVRYLQAYDWEFSDIHQGCVIPEVITFQLFSGLLYLAHVLHHKHDTIINTLWSYITCLFEQINRSDDQNVDHTIRFLLPSMLGISQAFQLLPYGSYSKLQLDFIFYFVKQATKQETLDSIRTVIAKCLKIGSTHARRTMENYWEKQLPLTPDRIIYDVMVIIRNVLARHISTNYSSNSNAINNSNDNKNNEKRIACPSISIYLNCCTRKPHLTHDIQRPWEILMNQPVHCKHIDKDMSAHLDNAKQSHREDDINALGENHLRALYVSSMTYYQGLRNNTKTKTKSNAYSDSCYMLGIMGTSLHVAALSSILMNQVDDVLVGHIIECLLTGAQDVNPWIYVAALDSSVLLAINFNQLHARITQAICQFLATPSGIFENEMEWNAAKVTIRKFAVTRLAEIIQTMVSTQPAISVLYSLLNEITHYSQSDAGAGATLQPSVSDNHRRYRLSTVDALDEKQRRQVCVNVLSAIIGVAVYLKDETIISQALSMLLLERKSFSMAAALPVLNSLSDLALVASTSVFEDILGVLSMYSREYLNVDNKAMWSTIVQTYTDLAKRIAVRPDLYHIYLTNMLSFFLEIGSKIRKTELRGVPALRSFDVPLVTKLGMLIPVLQALLEHDDFNPQDYPASESMISLHRNFWILCVLFGFVLRTKWIPQWHTALMVIARKSPLLVSDIAKDYWEQDVEYNSVLRDDHAADRQFILKQLKQDLLEILPSHASDIKYLSYAQLVFLLSVYHVESRRSQMGNTSYILRYFMNDTLASGALASCLEGIVHHVVSHFVAISSEKASAQSLGQEVNKQLKDALPLCCHRLYKVHDLACQAVDKIIMAFPQVFTEKSLITLLLELTQLLWLSCAAEYRNEHNPVYHFTSTRANITVELIDSFGYRRNVCRRLCEYATKWLTLSMDFCPLKVNGLLQEYLIEFNGSSVCMSQGAAHMGRTIASKVGKTAPRDFVATDFIPRISGLDLDDFSNFAKGFTSRSYYAGKVDGIRTKSSGRRHQQGHFADQSDSIRASLESLLREIDDKRKISYDRINQTVFCAAAYVISENSDQTDLIRYIVRIPVHAFTPESLRNGTDVWNWMMIERPDLEKRLMLEMLAMWFWSQRHRKGLFSPNLNVSDPFLQKMTYQPSDIGKIHANYKAATILFAPHEIWLRFIISHFFSVRHKDKHLVNISIILLRESFQNAHLMSTHPVSRLARFQLLYLGMQILCSVCLEATVECKIRSLVYDAAFNWFELPTNCRHGSWKSTALSERNIMVDFYRLVHEDKPRFHHLVSSTTGSQLNLREISSGLHMLLDGKTQDDISREHDMSRKLLLLLLENEIHTYTVWCNPLNQLTSIFGNQPLHDSNDKSVNIEDDWKTMTRLAWRKSPRMAVQLSTRFKSPIIRMELCTLIANNSLDAVSVPEALVILLGTGIQSNTLLDLRYLRYWAPVPPITATNYFLPAYGNQPMLLQYAMRSLEYYPVETVFFYIPQIVQAVRYDEMGYVERYIIKAGQVSQLFAHQIIWNMQANFYLDADKGCHRPDPMKPALERIIKSLLAALSSEDRQFYEREFKFFGDITAISGSLKEYIRFGQNEKKPMQKKRLDEELEKIQVDAGVYLPSNPDGRVIDISRTSGKPLQSHAKAPFMATFLIEKERNETDIATKNILKTSKKLPLTAEKVPEIKRKENGDYSDNDNDDLFSNLQHKRGNIYAGNDEDADDNDYDDDDDVDDTSGETYKIWQGAIFKMGDDCRQDVLALQLIAVFKDIFKTVGLDLYVYPYRVVATGPGMGVIDVLPQSISRDQLGREKVNSLYDYFVAKYGDENSVHFQRARMNFVQSVAAYSVISYLLQIKDRHNGNIMLDDKAHLIHIDFGFIFDIAPGGGILESSPFKLTSEMIQVMGGRSEQQPFRQFSELVIKAYLACRPYAELIIQLVQPMLESGLPCFKGQTVRRMRLRFQTDKSERAAAEFMVQRIKESFENQRTMLYDYFQKVTNGIPY